MRRTFSMLLCFLLLIGMITVTASAEPGERSGAFAEATEGQAFALAMTYWSSGYDETFLPDETEFAWNAAGWYAAWLYRTRGTDLIDEETVRAFQRSIGISNQAGEAEDWNDYRTPDRLRNADGSCSYHFGTHRLLIDELLGTQLELRISPGNRMTVDVAVIQHITDSVQAEKNYRFSFLEDESGSSAFPFRLRMVSLPDAGPVIDPALPFDWALLDEANTLDQVLSQYGSVRSYNLEYAPDDSLWYFLFDGEPARIYEGDGFCSGIYRGCHFDYGDDGSGEVRVRVGEIEDEGLCRESLNLSFRTDYRNAALLLFDRREGDRIWVDCYYSGGYRQKLAFDYGTLVLREAISFSEGGELLSTTRYEYGEPVPAFPFLEGWTRELREITVLWEDYHEGLRDLRRESIRLPQDWEYLPYGARWGEYTPYLNDRYLGDYAYPGDGMDYLLFLTTVKG